MDGEELTLDAYLDSLIPTEFAHDNAAVAREVKSLEDKGYLTREDNPEDKRSKRLYPLAKAEQLKSSKAHIEAEFYEWLTEDIDAMELEGFISTLNKIYSKCKAERKNDFINMKQRIEDENGK